MINKIIKICCLLMLIVIISPTYSRETLAVPLIKSADLSDFDRYSLTQRLTGEVIRLDIYDVVERSEITQLFEEQKIQHSGAIDFTSAVELGKMTGAENLLIGSVTRTKDGYAVDARIIHVESGLTKGSASYAHSEDLDGLIKKGMGFIANQLCGYGRSYEHFEENFLKSEASYEKMLKSTLKVNSFFGTHIDARNLMKARLLGNYRYYLNIILGEVAHHHPWDAVPYFKRELLIQITYLDMETLQSEYELRFD